MIKQLLFKIRVAFSWKTLTDAHDHARGFHSMENTITGDRRQVNPTCCPFVTNHWVFVGAGKAQTWDRLAGCWYTHG